ncbi:MAG: hypothetical protein HZA90_25140 [Verrucomicrobia bacterium]|nr:hypothetical protein [Verrucomicrobiota bacterium]
MPELAPAAVTSAAAPPTPPWAALLERFYERTSLPVPTLQRLRDDEVPPPYKSLLVHSADMTPTLEKYHQDRLGLEVLRRVVLGSGEYLREVVLTLAGNSRPVEYGVIRIWLKRFPEAARQLVLEEQRPLGGILLSEGIAHVSWPHAFFRVEADAHIGSALRLQHAAPLYGRRNVLLNGSRHLLAEVIEILPPVNGVAKVPPPDGRVGPFAVAPELTHLEPPKGGTSH